MLVPTLALVLTSASATDSSEGGWGFLVTNADRVGGWALALVLFFLMATGRFGSRKAFDQEIAAMRAGYAAKDEAHAELLAAKDETIRYLEDRNDRKQQALEARDRQVQQLLDEIAPSLQQWADATATVAQGKGRDSDART